MRNARILDRYIFRELLAPFFLSMATLTLVLLIQKLFRLAELAISKGVTLLSILQLLAYIMPSFLVITIPMSLLVATLTAFTRLSSDSEITAMKASRFSLYSMLRPVLAFAIIASAATALTSIVLLPNSNHALKVHLFNMVKSRAMVGIEPGVFTSTFNGMVIYVDKMESLDEMQGIFISDERSSKDPFTIIARWGKLITDPQSFNVTLAMEEGSIHTQPSSDQAYTLTSFNFGKLYLNIDHALIAKDVGNRAYKETGTFELARKFTRARASGETTVPIESELHMRFAIPVACLIFGMIGAPLGIRKSRTGKSAGIALALGVFLVYYIILGAGRNLSEAGTISPATAYWVPNLLTSLAAGLLIFQKGHEYDFRIAERARDIYRRLTRKR